MRLNYSLLTIHYSLYGIALHGYHLAARDGIGINLQDLAESPGLAFERLVSDADDPLAAGRNGPLGKRGLETRTRSEHADDDQRSRTLVAEDEIVHETAALTRDVAEIMRGDGQDEPGPLLLGRLFARRLSPAGKSPSEQKDENE